MKRRLLRALGGVLLLSLSFSLGRLYPVLVRPELIAEQDAKVEGISADAYRLRYRDELGGFIDITPQGDADTLMVFYPGGLVRPQAYAWLGVALSARGVRTLIPRFPFDLAVTAPGRAAALIELISQEAPPERVILAGHSLGAAMAARFVARNPGLVDLLVLMAGYSASNDDLSGTEVDVLVLAAAHDELATLEQVEEGLERLPSGTELVVLEGAVHSFFGRYGPQRGDGVPTITRAQAERDIVAALEVFLEGQSSSRQGVEGGQ